MGVLSALFGGSALALSGGGKKTTQTPPINASSPDEADFIKYFRFHNPGYQETVANSLTGSSLRMLRQIRSQRRNTRLLWTHFYFTRHGYLIAKANCTNNSRTDNGQLKILRPEQIFRLIRVISCDYSFFLQAAKEKKKPRNRQNLHSASWVVKSHTKRHHLNLK